MARLKKLFEDMGFQDVATFIASGNVLFSTESTGVEALGARIETHLGRELGYAVQTFLRTPARLAEIAAIGDDDGDTDRPPASSHYVVFLHAPPHASLREDLARLASEMDAFEIDGSEIHWRIRGKLSDSPLFGGDLDRALRSIPTTTRNLTTLRRIVARTGAS